MTRKVCVITGTRAEYGLLNWVMRFIKEDDSLELQIIATGTHLSPEFGLTCQEIINDNFTVDAKVEMLMSSDTGTGIVKSMGVGMLGFADALCNLQPDLILVLGDRFEIFSAVSAALVLNIPVAHLHGGESSEGAIDEAFRHSITKMSHIHFVAADAYRQRVIQLGEQPINVHTVGGLGIDNIKKLKLLGRTALEKSLGLKLLKKNLLITFHPVTLESKTASTQMKELFKSLVLLQDTMLIFTLPNADTDGRGLIKLINDFAAKNKNVKAFTSMGQLRYLSTMAHVDAVVGNSSSGLLETPSFKKGTINIGDRQRGRLQAQSIINCEPTSASISLAIKRLYSTQFQSKLPYVENPYGTGGASKSVVEILKTVRLDNLLKKSFHDLNKVCE